MNYMIYLEMSTSRATWLSIGRTLWLSLRIYTPLGRANFHPYSGEGKLGPKAQRASSTHYQSINTNKRNSYLQLYIFLENDLNVN